MKIELNCASCGDNNFNLDHGVADHATIHCNRCGHRIGTMAELKERVAAEVLSRIHKNDFS
ncbi:hypothetical protein [Sphingomonas limnosediminicola]